MSNEKEEKGSQSKLFYFFCFLIVIYDFSGKVSSQKSSTRVRNKNRENEGLNGKKYLNYKRKKERERQINKERHNETINKDSAQVQRKKRIKIRKREWVTTNLLPRLGKKKIIVRHSLPVRFFLQHSKYSNAKFIFLMFYLELLFLLCVVRGRSSDPFFCKTIMKNCWGKKQKQKQAHSIKHQVVNFRTN